MTFKDFISGYNNTNVEKNEKKKNKEEIFNKKEIFNYNKEIAELRKLLDEERNKNKILENKNKDFNNTINKLKKDNKKKFQSDKIISVLFMTQGNQDIINYSMACKTTDLFSSLEERLYQDYPNYRNIEKIFMVNTNRISRNKTLEENNIKNNDIINIFPID